MRERIKAILAKFGFRGTPREKAVIDLVCGMQLSAGKTPHAVEHGGETYYFCSPSCKDHFVSEPEKYVGEHDDKEQHGNCCH